MKRTVGYLIALFMGLFIGWVAQQFWLSQLALDAATAQNYSISRQQQRLSNLREQLKQATSSASETPLIDRAPSNARFDLALNEKHLDLALEIFFQLDSATLNDALRLAQLAYDAERYEMALTFLYEYRYGLDLQAEQILLQEIYRLVEKIDARLSERSDIDQLVEIYRQLTFLEADNSFYYLRLSYWQLQLGNSTDASQSLLGAVNDIEFQGEIDKLQEAIALYEKIGPQLAVPLRQEGEHYLVTVNLDSQLNVELMLDTGASKTVIKREVLANTGLMAFSEADKTLMNTANGQTLGYSVQLNNVSIASLSVSSLEVVVMELPSFKYDGLLGMNLLSQFDFKIDQENASLNLAPKKPVLRSAQH